MIVKSTSYIFLYLYKCLQYNYTKIAYKKQYKNTVEKDVPIVKKNVSLNVGCILYQIYKRYCSDAR